VKLTHRRPETTPYVRSDTKGQTHQKHPHERRRLGIARPTAAPRASVAAMTRPRGSWLASGRIAMRGRGCRAPRRAPGSTHRDDVFMRFLRGALVDRFEASSPCRFNRPGEARLPRVTTTERHHRGGGSADPQRLLDLPTASFRHHRARESELKRRLAVRHRCLVRPMGAASTSSRRGCCPSRGSRAHLGQRHVRPLGSTTSRPRVCYSIGPNAGWSSETLPIYGVTV